MGTLVRQASLTVVPKDPGFSTHVQNREGGLSSQGQNIALIQKAGKNAGGEAIHKILPTRKALMCILAA